MPLDVDQLINSLTTAPAGMRPRPVTPMGEEMVPVPVYVDVGGTVVRAAGFSIVPGRGGKPACLIIEVDLPAGVHMATGEHTPATPPPAPAEPVAEVAESVGWTRRDDGVIPELEAVDPAVLRPNTDRPAGAVASGAGTGDRVPNAGDN